MERNDDPESKLFNCLFGKYWLQRSSGRSRQWQSWQHPRVSMMIGFFPAKTSTKVQVSNIIILRVHPVPALPFQGEVMLNLLLLHFSKANHIPPPFCVCNRLFKIDVLFQTAATLCLLGTSLLCFWNSSPVDPSTLTSPLPPLSPAPICSVSSASPSLQNQAFHNQQ